MNLLKVVNDGISGRTRGLSFGLPKLNSLLGGIQKKMSFAVGAEPKVGKTAFVDFSFVLSPYLENPNQKKKWIYFSFEIDRVEKEAKYVSFFMKRDYNIDVSSNYILGREMLPSGEPVIVTPEHYSYISNIYTTHIIPLFGLYDEDGNKLQDGMIEYIEEKENPTGIYNYLINYAEKHGEFIYEDYYTKEQGKSLKKQRIIGYKEHDPELTTIVIIDHIRAMRRERGFNAKENIDKMSEYHVTLRNLTKICFVFISHLNRGITDIDRLKYMKDTLYPTNDDFKDSGNLSEDCSNVITLFDAANEKYNISTHFGVEVRKHKGKYRSLHIVMSRHAECPKHIPLLFDGKNNRFREL